MRSALLADKRVSEWRPTRRAATNQPMSASAHSPSRQRALLNLASRCAQIESETSHRRAPGSIKGPDEGASRRKLAFQEVVSVECRPSSRRGDGAKVAESGASVCRVSMAPPKDSVVRERSFRPAGSRSVLRQFEQVSFSSLSSIFPVVLANRYNE